MTRVVVYYAPNHNRSTIVANAMLTGIRACGEHVEMRSSAAYQRPDADVAVFYSLAGKLRQVITEYPARKRTVLFADLGYWGRHKRTRWDGYHKLVINGRHPTPYFQRRPHDASRFERFGLSIQPWRTKGRHILVAGMSGKAAAAEGGRAEAWERETIAKLRRLTRRPIIYRPKPKWMDARPIDGAEFQVGVPLEDALRDCHAVVTHHSNVAVDALLAGVPCFCWDGAASVLSGKDLRQIEEPLMPDGREQWAWDLAWTQFSVAEMEDGTAWRYFKGEGLVP